MAKSLLSPSEGKLLENAGTIYRLRILTTDFSMSGAQLVEGVHAKFASELFQQFEAAYDTNNNEKLRVSGREEPHAACIGWTK